MAYPPWINIFGGGPLWPSSVSYISYNLDTIGQSITLQFPQVATTNYVTAGTINVLTSNTTHTITMPDVTIVSPGYTMWVRNSGSVNLTLYKNDGSVLLVIAPGLTWGIQVIDNTTAAGLWYTLQFGAGSSSVSSAALAGAGLIVDPLAITKLATNVIAREFSSGGYVVAQSDRAILLVWVGGSNTLYLPDIATLLPGFQCYVSNMSVGGILTIECQVMGQLINKEASITCNPGVSFEIAAGPTEYYTIGTPQFSLSTFSFPDGSISAPSINFVTDPSSGFSHSFTDSTNQSLNFSLNATLQAAFALVSGVSIASFVGVLAGGSIQSIGGLYVYGSDATKTRSELNVSGPTNILNTYVYNVAGTESMQMQMTSTGKMNLVQANYERDQVSYLAWMRTFI